jgi:hypothetical protein
MPYAPTKMEATGMQYNTIKYLGRAQRRFAMPVCLGAESLVLHKEIQGQIHGKRLLQAMHHTTVFNFSSTMVIILTICFNIKNCTEILICSFISSDYIQE